MKGHFRTAVNLYTHALSLVQASEPPNKEGIHLQHILYANRALAKIKLRLYADAVNDCTAAIELNPEYYKSYLRRADANMKLKKYEQAINDYHKLRDMGYENAADLEKLAQRKLKESQFITFYDILEVDMQCT